MIYFSLSHSWHTYATVALIIVFLKLFYFLSLKFGMTCTHLCKICCSDFLMKPCLIRSYSLYLYYLRFTHICSSSPVTFSLTRGWAQIHCVFFVAIFVIVWHIMYICFWMFLNKNIYSRTTLRGRLSNQVTPLIRLYQESPNENLIIQYGHRTSLIRAPRYSGLWSATRRKG